MSSRVRDRLRLGMNASGLALLLLTWLLGDGGLLLLGCFAACIVGGEIAYRFLDKAVFTPYMGMAFAPLLLVHYSSVVDFRIRLVCFFVLLYVLILARQRTAKPVPAPLDNAPPWRVWLACFSVFALAAVVLYERDIQLSGDEPHYVMLAQSLVEDGDLNLKNNLENKTYFKYLPVEIRLHGMVRAGAYRSFHLPGVSFLLVPFYYLFDLLDGAIPANLFFRLCAALINAFFALALFQAFRALLPGKEGSRYFVFFLVTFPLAFHAVHLYPELPAAALLVFAYLFGREKGRFFLSGLLLAMIPWFHLKFVIPTAILAAAVLAAAWGREGKGREKIRRLAAFAAAPVASLLLLALYSHELYGVFNPSSISPEKNFFSIPWPLKVETLLSFFLDQRDGLIIYAPLFLLVFLAARKEVRARIKDFSLLAAILASYILFHAFTTIRGAYSPATRPTLFVMWIMAIFVAAVYQQARGGQRTLCNLLAGLGVFASLWLYYYPLFLYQPVTRGVSQRASSLLLFLGSDVVNLASVFPSYLKMANAAYLPNWIWSGGLLLALALYYSRISWPFTKKPLPILYALLGSLLVAALCFFPHVYLQTRYSAAGLSFFSNSRNFVHKKESAGFRMLPGQDYDLFFDLRGCAADGLDLRFSGAGNVDVKIRNGRKVLLAERGSESFRLRTSLTELKKFSLGGRTLVHLGIDSTSFAKKDFFMLRFE